MHLNSIARNPLEAMKNQRGASSSSGEGHVGPSDAVEQKLLSLPSSDSTDSLLGRASVPRMRKPSRHRFEKNDTNGSQHLLSLESSSTSFTEMNGDAMEKGYGDDYRRRAPFTPRILYRWSTYGSAVFCIIVTMFVTVTIISRGMWESAEDGVGAGQCASIFESEEIMALKASSTLENLKHGAVASDQGICSEIGVAILRDYGGHAVDAAVATALCVGVVNPVSSGLGGGTFILIHSDAPKTTGLPQFHDKREEESISLKDGMMTEVIDAREVAPAASTSEMFVNTDSHASVFGGLASAVPGELRGLELAHARYGRLPWSTVVEPAMKLARDGVPVSVHLAAEIKKIVSKAQSIPSYPVGLRKLITRDGKWTNPLKVGDKLRNPALAKTLQAVMKNGADALYSGDLAVKLVEDIRTAEGIITVEDIEGYRPTLRSPIVAEDVGGFTLVGAPPPGTGGAVIAGALRFLTGYKTPFATASDTLSVHRMVEACRHGYALRMSLSDPEYNTETTKAVVNDLTRGSFMDSLREMTRDDSTLRLSQYGGKWAQLKDTEGRAEAYDAHEGDRRLYAEADGFELLDSVDDDFLTTIAEEPVVRRRLARPFGYLEDFGTSHISVVDKDGNAVALTTSVNSKFGSGVFSESTGILMNNQMDDFGTPSKTSFYGVRPTESNYVKPGKKPLSSMSPILMFRRHEGAKEGEWGDLYLVIGGSGGPKIITAVLQVILNFVFRGMPLFESMAHPRVHDQLLYQDAHVTTVEHGQLVEGPMISVSNRTRSALANRGHKLLELDYLGTVQAIAVDPETGELSAVSDIRKGGTPAGY